MSHTVITHIGVSALGCDALRSVQSQDYAALAKQLAEGIERPDALALAQRDLIQGLKRYWGRGMQPRHQRIVSPAEIAALSLLLTERRQDGSPPLPIDRLVLLRSDTRGGEFCARLLEQALVDPDSDIPPNPSYPRVANGQLDIVRIKGLSITDERTPDPASSQQDFVRQGLVNYVTEIMKLYDQMHVEGGGTLTFNITGGYKGMVPIARDIALLLSAYARALKHNITIEFCYLYATSEKLIYYPPLPMMLSFKEFPMSDLEAAGNADGTAIAKKDDEHEGLFSFEGNVARRSALGEVVWALFKKIDYYMLLTSTDERIIAIRKELEQYRKNLRILNEKVAHNGGKMQSPLGLINDIEGHQQKIDELKTKLKNLGVDDSNIHD